MSSDNLHRTQAVSNPETGTSETIRHNAYRHVLAAKSISQRILHFERITPDQLSCIAEATGAFFYVFPGLASIASFFLNTPKELRSTAYGSFFQIVLAFTIGDFVVLFIRCGKETFETYNCIFWVTEQSSRQEFPWRKVPWYILSQILGATVAGLLVVVIHWDQMRALKEAMLATNQPLVSPIGPAGFFLSFPGASQRFGCLFMVEFFVDSLIGVLIWTAIEATVIIAITYGAMVWRLAPAPIIKDFARSLARSVDGRIFGTLILFGGIFSFRLYFWVAILVDFPVLLLSAATWELFLRERVEGKIPTDTEKMVTEDELRQRTSSEDVGFIRSVS
ncbi:hypothetical protein DTO271G3_431 [Paecilomyces variotii]|nr:hypothetical protein DTO271G3_431 [Paecilomyces variotii]